LHDLGHYRIHHRRRVAGRTERFGGAVQNHLPDVVPASERDPSPSTEITASDLRR
jgi:hypothetical protein